VYPLIVARQRLGINVTGTKNTHATEELSNAFPMRSGTYQKRKWSVLPRTSCIINDVISNSDHTSSHDGITVNNERHIMCKEAVVVYLRYYPIWMEEFRTNHKKEILVISDERAVA
jgi:hypothetical protein